MANPLDTDAGSELFSNYEAELKLVQADLNQKLDQIEEQSGEERKSAVRGAQRALEEAKELLDQMNLEKANIPTSSRSKANQKYRNAQTDIDTLSRKLKTLASQSSDRKALFGDRYTDDPDSRDAALEQRQQLLSGTDRLGRSSQRLRDSQRIALETEAIGAGTLADLHQQRNVIEHTHQNLQQSEGYVDRSVKTLRGMARRMATNRIITIAIITVLVLLIIGVIYSKFR
ncbi:t-SNARE VTI1 [Knufia obscura]|uniref:t-SNARE VTI1 n=1 Tax=Knufia obscura TaxID=1635080 RepID=A0ABR0RUA7_9EURO|nr:t-SNARE VTI1 [Knufia obscura]